MNTNMIKRCNMFTWITEEELSWLFVLEQLETEREELEIEDIADGINKLSENKNLEELRELSMHLSGLQEERLIEADTVNLEDTIISSLRITCRGRKVLEEGRRILSEEGFEQLEKVGFSVPEETKTNKGDAVKRFVYEVAVGVCVEAACTIFKRIASGMI